MSIKINRDGENPKSRSKLAESRENGDEEKIIEALESTVVRLGEKVAEAEKQLQETEGA